MSETKKLPLSGSVLKTIAIIAMIIDHASVIFLGPETTVFRIIGRIAFPIFAFFIAEGAKHSKNTSKYALRLLVFAFISEIPFDLAFSGTFLEFQSQNVFFTLLLGLLSVLVLKELKGKKLSWLGIFSTVLFAVFALLLQSDYGFTGVVAITLFYVFSSKTFPAKILGYVLICTLTVFVFNFDLILGYASSQIYALAAVPLLALYNGKKGFRMNKYVFYAFYPAHISILAGIKYLIEFFQAS